MADSLSNVPADSSKGTARRVAEIAVGYLTVVAVLVYPIGLVSLCLQIWNAYRYGLSDAFFVMSVAPTTLAASKIYDFIMWGLLAIGIVEQIAWLIFGRRAHDSFIEILSSMPGEGSEKFIGMANRSYKFTRLSMILGAFVGLTAPVGLSLIFIESWRTVALYCAYVIFCCVGGAIGGILTLLFAERPYYRSWKSTGAAYAFAILAGISLTGTSSPGLPSVQFETGETKAGDLLGHSSGYWYVFDRQDTLLAIPDDDTGDVRFSSE